MRCAIYFDESKPLVEQEVMAWGEMQSLDEEPSYKESDIKDEAEKKRFEGYKKGFDDVCTDLENLVSDGVISEYQSGEIQNRMCSDLGMALFSILDNEIEEDD